MSSDSMLKIGGVSAVASAAIGLLTILSAILLYTSFPLKPHYIGYIGINIMVPLPNWGFTPATQYISELGIGPTATIFNVGMTITGIATIPLFLSIPKHAQSTTGKIIAALGIIAAIGLIGVGLFPMSAALISPYNPTLPIPLSPPSLHGTSARIFFISISLAAIASAYASLKQEQFTKWTAATGILLAATSIAFVATSSPPAEWATAILAFLWILTLGIPLLKK